MPAQMRMVGEGSPTTPQRQQKAYVRCMDGVMEQAVLQMEEGRSLAAVGAAYMVGILWHKEQQYMFSFS